MAFDFHGFVNNCDRFGAAIRKLGGEVSPIQAGAPATEAEVADVETRLGRNIPIELRSILIEHARSFSFRWEHSHADALPHPWKHASEGRCLWSLDLLALLNADLARWKESVYADAADRYGKHWHHAFAVCATGRSDGTSSSSDFSGGDFFAIRESVAGEQSVVFLSHDGAAVNGWALANGFDDFLMRWSAIGCVGGESGWGFDLFLQDEAAGFDVHGEVAATFRDLLGVKL
jgi:hypothetical protein